MNALQDDVDWLMSDYNNLISSQIGWVLDSGGAVLGYVCASVRPIPHTTFLGKYWHMSQTTSVRFSRKLFGSRANVGPKFGCEEQLLGSLCDLE